MKTLARLRRLLYSQFSSAPLSERPNGISCFTRTRFDEWLPLSLRSVREFADEVIVIDTVGNLEKELSLLSDECSMTIKYHYLEPENPDSVFGTQTDFTRQTETGVRESAYKWIFEWNADFVAVESTMKRLRTRLLRLGEREKRHYYFFLPFVNLAGDIRHTNAVFKKDVGDPKESFLFRHSEDLVVRRRTPESFAKITVPKYYRPVWLKGPYFFHLDTVKPIERLLYRRYWWAWAGEGRGQTLQDFVKESIIRDFGTPDVREARKKCLLQILGAIRPLKIGLSTYPEEMRRNLDLFKKYELVTSDGSVVSRRDLEEMSEK